MSDREMRFIKRLSLGLLAAMTVSCSPEAPPASSTEADSNDSVQSVATALSSCVGANASCNDDGQCCSNACDFSHAPQSGKGVCLAVTSLDGPLGQLPDATISADFRVNPPAATSIAVSPGPGGSAIMQVQFARDARLGASVEIGVGQEESTLLHDNGVAPDIKAGDGIFSATLRLSFAQVAALHKQMLTAFQQRDLKTFPVFAGRDLVRQQAIDFGTAVLRFPTWLPLLVNPARTLTVTATSVVDDPGRTFNPCTGVGNSAGVWTFNHLMTEMANQLATGMNPSDLTLDWLKRWAAPQVANGFVVPARPNINAIIAGWPKLVDGRLDLARAPIKLLAIVNRIDLAGASTYGRVSGAEGRFVFQVMTPNCTSTPFLIIFEYGVPRDTCVSIRDWAQQWLALNALVPGTVAYNSALQAITEQFVKRNANPTKPNGSAINQVRSNEIQLASPWELREFNLNFVPAPPALLRLVTVKQTPDAKFNQQVGGLRGADLATFINANQAAILADTYTVPNLLPFAPGDPFLGARSPSVLSFWNAAGIVNNDARHHFSLNTCDGCHGAAETGTIFTHIKPPPFGGPAFGVPATLSGFLTGITVPDPVSGVPRNFNDLARRASILSTLAASRCLPTLGRPPITAVPFELPFPPIEVRPTISAH